MAFWRMLRRLPLVLLCVVGWVLAVAPVAFAALVLALFRVTSNSWIWRIAGTLISPFRAANKLADYTLLWLAVRRRGAAADRVLYEHSAGLRAMRQLAMAFGQDGLWIANDWLTMPLAAEGSATFGGVWVYDSHEYATQEFAERFDWRLFRQPLVKTIERRYVGSAKVVTSVSPEITAALQQAYDLKVPTATLRNMPAYQSVAFRPVRGSVRLLYHGIVMRGRGLEETIRSMRQWPDAFRLTIRGSGQADYVRGLVELAAASGVADRVTLAPPVPVDRLVSAAADHDIGLMALPGHSAHNAYALPNKVFEYLMAGLAICVTDLPSMAAVVRETGAGVLAGDGGEDAIAAAIRDLTPERIDAMKLRALDAAKRLHFEADAVQVCCLYESALTAAVARAPGVNRI